MEKCIKIWMEYESEPHKEMLTVIIFVAPFYKYQYWAE
jgi:hypothetical protein